jgi:hypothetical protein
LRRSSWLDVVGERAGAVAELTSAVRQALTRLDDRLFEAWNLGDNIILAWTREAAELRFVVVRHYAIIEAGHGALMNSVLAGPKQVPAGQFTLLCDSLGKAAQVVHASVGEAVDPRLIDSMVTRYSVSLVRSRAVLLLDAVGFSLRSPLEQVAMLNSLSYSVNAAYSQLLAEDVRVNFARTTTGDGFYIWNRATTPEASVALYELMMLVLADNAIAASKATRFPVPQLRAAFHVGEHYEFYQVEALNPTTFAYIVGQVTIDLSRLIEKTLPGQIVLGDFSIDWPDRSGGRRLDTLEFVQRTATTMDRLKGLVVGGDPIEQVRCYLTGERGSDGRFQVTRYETRDKHGLTRSAYNAKINIHRRHAAPIFLGLQHKDVPGRT